jgi:hypothetical protein
LSEHFQTPAFGLFRGRKFPVAGIGSADFAVACCRLAADRGNAAFTMMAETAAPYDRKAERKPDRCGSGARCAERLSVRLSGV